MKEMIVRSSLNKDDYLKDVSNMTASEYILDKVRKAVNEGKTNLIVSNNMTQMYAHHIGILIISRSILLLTFNSRSIPSRENHTSIQILKT